MGAPGAGKGTQARLLQERLQLPQVSTGDIFRSLKNLDTPIAQEVRRIMTAGQLVPDELTTRLVRERTAQDDPKNGYILDGYPRTPSQAADLEALAREQGNDIVPIFIDVPQEQLERRTTAPRNCPAGGGFYNIFFKPPRNTEGVELYPDIKLVQGADHNSETVRARLATYDEQTRPLLDYYRRLNLLRVVDGGRDPEAIYKDIEEKVSKDA